ncbi:CASP-like protein 4A1 isoform X2 [Crotalus tigris]|uniref:CASP-like protein 4A1 isoform X2 n=1 Tax=Crotalus tigris TaxID=88082 RepID=UPI00192F8303|nr:CASP-like protein 4A1 isoform X2 [Crotalus tigris]
MATMFFDSLASFYCSLFQISQEIPQPPPVEITELMPPPPAEAEAEALALAPAPAPAPEPVKKASSKKLCVPVELYIRHSISLLEGLKKRPQPVKLLQRRSLKKRAQLVKLLQRRKWEDDQPFVEFTYPPRGPA